MSKKSNYIMLASVAVAALWSNNSIAADEEISFSGNVSFTNDYRFRGVSLSNEDIAIQGGIDVTTDAGFYSGIWGSSIEQFNGAETELDLYGGFAAEIGELSLDLGVIVYTYPGGTNTNYIEGYGSLGFSMQELSVTLGGAYAFSNANLGNQDNIYLYGDAEYPLGDSGLSFSSHLGWEDGAFGYDKIDWLVGLNYTIRNITLGIAYVDTDQALAGSDAAAVFTIGTSF